MLKYPCLATNIGLTGGDGGPKLNGVVDEVEVVVAIKLAPARFGGGKSRGVEEKWWAIVLSGRRGGSEWLGELMRLWKRT